MKLDTTGRVEAAEFPVVVWFDETRADILTFEFHTWPRDADWNIGRDLVATGLMQAAGKMDVFVYPAPDTDDVAIELCSPFGHAIIRLPWHPIAAFIRETYDRVPQGTEYTRLDWDQLLTTADGAS